MSSLERLSIRGIRNFGHEAKDKQTIEFSDQPLILIAGQNGAGKTAVIECLHYISTGDVPPWSSKGTAFVHDLKVAKKKKVKAQVKLTFKDKACRSVTAQLSPLVKEDLEKESGMAYELCIDDRVIDVHGVHEEKTFGEKEFRSRMAQLLGVSEPVLTNVIFCHQEDSCWPFGADKAVYDKFDKIFDASRFTKAVDKMKEVKKEQEETISVCKTNIPSLEKDKEHAEQLRRDLQHEKDLLSAEKDKIAKIEQELGGVEEQNSEELERIEKAIELGKQEKCRLLVQKGSIEKEKKQHHETITKRNKKISQDARELKIPGFDNLTDSSKVKEFEKLLGDMVRSQGQEAEECKRKYEKEKAAVDKDVNKLEHSKTEFDVKIRMNTSNMNKNKKELEEIARTLRVLEASSQKLVAPSKGLKQTDKNLASMNIEQLQSEKEKKEAKVRQLSEEMSALAMQSEQMEMLQKKKEQIETIYKEHEQEVIRLMKDFPRVGMKKKLSDFLDKKHADIEDVQRKLEQRKCDMASLKAKRELLTEETQESALTGRIRLLQEYIDSLRQDAKCPLCHKVGDLVQEVSTLSDAEHSKVTNKLEDINSSIEELEPTISELESSLRSMQEDERTVNDMKPDIWLMDYFQGELKKLERLCSVNHRTLSQIFSEQQSQESIIEEMSQTIKEKQQKQQELEQEIKKQKEQRDKLRSTNQDLETEIKKAKDEQKLFQEDLSKLGEKQKNIREQKEVYEKKMKKVEELKQKREAIASLTTEIDSYMKDANRGNLEICQQNILKNQDELKKLEKQRTILNINQERNILENKKSHAEGKQTELEKKVKDLEEKLKKYKNADTKYEEKLIELTVTEKAHSDVEKYCTALEKAIGVYHQKKMEEINKFIKDYWRKTYKGTDIDYIEIQSEPEKRNKRNYTYRVVMIAGDTKLDMRGRCSAGHKALASLIIRLALAEAFCHDCGILALDEPTTNLDEENMRSLAEALRCIIDRQEARRKIQLIVITHNEDFVEQLGNSDCKDFYRITTNNECKSVIEKVSMTNYQTVTE